MYSKSISEYQKFIVEKLSKIDGVGHIQSKVVMSEVKKDMSLPMTEALINSGKKVRA